MVPATEADRELTQKWKLGQVIHGKFTKMRNAKFHGKFFSMLDLAWEYWEPVGGRLYRSDLPRVWPAQTRRTACRGCTLIGNPPQQTAAEQATKARLTAFNCWTAGVRLEIPGRSDLFAERMINAQGFKDGLNGEYMVDSREQVFTQSGWSTAIECNAGKKAKVKGKKSEKTLKIVQL